MRETLNQNGWACIVFALVLLVAGIVLYPSLAAMGPIDRSSPGSGIGVVYVGVVFVVGAVVLLTVAGAVSAFVAKSYYSRIPAAMQPYGLIGYLVFLLPFAILWWFFIRS
jgi:hypothetical protein